MSLITLSLLLTFLYLTESGTKTRTFKGFLGNSYQVRCKEKKKCMGVKVFGKCVGKTVKLCTSFEKNIFDESIKSIKPKWLWNNNKCNWSVKTADKADDRKCSTPVKGPFDNYWKPVCQLHDFCLKIKGRTDGQCDREFKHNMKEMCKGYDPVREIACKAAADVYYAGVEAPFGLGSVLRGKIDQKYCKGQGSSGGGGGQPLRNLVPIYRYYLKNKNHFYTPNPKEIGTTTKGRIGKYGYKSQGIGFYTVRTNIGGTIPLYRYYHSNTNHFYTTNWHEIGTLTPGQVGKYGYKSEGNIGRCYPTKSKSGLVALHRYYSPGRNDHMYTVHTTEMVYGKGDYKYEGIQCYVYPSKQGPVTRAQQVSGLLNIDKTKHNLSKFKLISKDVNMYYIGTLILISLLIIGSVIGLSIYLNKQCKKPYKEYDSVSAESDSDISDDDNDYDNEQ